MSSYGSSPAASSGSRTNGLAVASLVCGVIGVLFASVILGPLAIVFGAVGLRQAPAKGGAGLAKAGLVLGVVDLIIFVVLIAVAASHGGFSWYVGG
ncbi:MULTISPECIES: DUF4190 domain-containing protein [unclassified Streptomyces]|jgi:hypothetical protein|uniref:DUF4190 domain-containing protein n=1 Tax=unclassified Streptomyces TaxID=2593676 RepID=UPI0036835F7C